MSLAACSCSQIKPELSELSHIISVKRKAHIYKMSGFLEKGRKEKASLCFSVWPLWRSSFLLFFFSSFPSLSSWSWSCFLTAEGGGRNFSPRTLSKRALAGFSHDSGDAWVWVFGLWRVPRCGQMALAPLLSAHVFQDISRRFKRFSWIWTFSADFFF